MVYEYPLFVCLLQQKDLCNIIMDLFLIILTNIILPVPFVVVLAHVLPAATFQRPSEQQHNLGMPPLTNRKLLIYCQILRNDEVLP
mmetsp:Transcript_3320/g.5070  ORF Transcript_3320/g.5070 Transcript_3320/m.5070 type:complete len:86 (-) Transcript_3320:1192-1449(-)